MFYTVGIDVGSSSIKTVVFSFQDDGTEEKLVDTSLIKIRKRDARKIVADSYKAILFQNDLKEEDIVYTATTGEGEIVDFRTGHFYSMTTHAKGAFYINKSVRSVIDVGALHAKAIVIDDKSKVLDYRMTSQCASGSGQFLENISRYLGIAIEDLGKISNEADNPEIVSNICAVLAETDVINMVSRGISQSNILKGIHLSMGRRMIRLLRTLNSSGDVLVTGGLANDEGLIAAMQELADKDEFKIKFLTDKSSIFAGSIGAALWGAFRHLKMQANAS